MHDVTAAEAQRRSREWLRVELDDPLETARIEQARQQLSLSNVQDIDALIAVGEYRATRALLLAIDRPDAFLLHFAHYFMASGDATFARGIWPRVLDACAGAAEVLSTDTARGIANAAEAIGDAGFAAQLAVRARQLADAAPRARHPITTFVYGVLGYAPDAAKGRLTLRPDFQDAGRRITVQNLRMGDALIAVEYTRTEDALRFELAQTAGAYPLRLIFAPLLSRPVAAVFVDQTRAELDFRPHRDGLIIPVQIMLDDRRTVSFHM
ncbi:MAG: hypothetical protein ACT443_09245 [Gemmatimonadota bacterium]